MSQLVQLSPGIRVTQSTPMKQNISNINLIDTSDVINYSNYMNEKVRSPSFAAIQSAKIKEIESLESQLLQNSDTCTVRKLNSFLDNIHNVDPEKIKYLLKKNFYTKSIASFNFNLRRIYE